MAHTNKNKQKRTYLQPDGFVRSVVMSENGEGNKKIQKTVREKRKAELEKKIIKI